MADKNGYFARERVLDMMALAYDLLNLVGQFHVLVTFSDSKKNPIIIAM